MIVLKMEAASTYETSVNFYRTTQRSNPEGRSAFWVVEDGSIFNSYIDNNHTQICLYIYTPIRMKLYITALYDEPNMLNSNMVVFWDESPIKSSRQDLRFSQR
jgi:hypothetical protein